MADKSNTTNITTVTTATSDQSKSIWLKQAEEAKFKNDAEKDAQAKAAFEATFVSSQQQPQEKQQEEREYYDSDSEDEKEDSTTAGDVEPTRCTAQGTGISGGEACTPLNFTVVARDAEGRRVTCGGAQVRVRVAPAVSVGGADVEGIVKDNGDGSYTVTYVVPKKGNYMVHVECDGKGILGSPFPVFFSAGNPTGGLLGMAPSTSSYPNMVNQTMPNMPNYSGSVSGAFPGLLGMVPGVVSGASGGVILPGMGSSLGEICRDYLSGRCGSTSCKFNHPSHSLLMTALAASTTMGTLSQVPMAPSAAAMAAAQAIVAAKALQAHAAAQAQSTKASSNSGGDENRVESLKKTIQVSNLSPLLTVDQLKQLFGFSGTIVDCTITDSKHFAYIEYSKPEEATAALALNNMDVGGRPLNVEMAKSLPPKSSMASSSLPMMMQQAVAMQQMQFQQALLMQQTLAAQQAANRVATMKSATELAAARAAEISKKLQADGLVIEGTDTDKKSRSPSTRPKSRSRSRSKSASPIKYRSRRRSRSYSPPARRSRDYRHRSPVRSRHYSSYENERRYYRDSDDRNGRRDVYRSRDDSSPASRRNRDRSASPRSRKSYRDDVASPKRRRESPAEGTRRSSRADSRSPRHHRRRSPSSEDDKKSKRSRRSTSRSREVKHISNKKENEREEKSTKRKSRRSRSESLEEVNHVERGSPEVVERIRSGHRRHSRSRSPEERHRTSEKGERIKEGKSRHRDKRRARSRSTDQKHRKSRKTSPENSGNHRSSHRKHSGSKSKKEDNIEETLSIENSDELLKPEIQRSAKGSDAYEDRSSNSMEDKEVVSVAKSP